MLNSTISRKFSKKDITNAWLQDEDLDLNLLTTLLVENSELGPEAVLKDNKFNSLLNAFELKWIFGSEPEIPVLNLTTDSNKQIFYSATNVGVLYNYCSKKMTLLRGHQSKIISVSVDRTGKWLATAECGRDNAIMIWDAEKSSSVWTIFNHPPKGNKLLHLAMSPNAKILVTISKQQEITIDFWLWTYGKDDPHDSYIDEQSLDGAPKSIEFHPNKENHIMVVFESSVLFFIWDYQTKKLQESESPKTPPVGVTGMYTDGTYVEQCHEAFVSTSKGCVLVFGTSIFSKQYSPEEVDNHKFYVKTVKISKGQINCITSVDE